MELTFTQNIFATSIWKWMKQQRKNRHYYQNPQVLQITILFIWININSVKRVWNNNKKKLKKTTNFKKKKYRTLHNRVECEINEKKLKMKSI